ncbi:DNA mismatch repair protein MutS [Xaviernesmea oryzae]|uniref:DNA mismatch repair protein MutS n=1 Tax=Xaviernesmea oryzae TaxID=464029 RepID=A0A1Q9AYJ2_9HYPH|nr:Smr/MutS family protein [Xaviernesmea oryzae]OLP60490.1 DNA mismatch repair protein MutS [Xaviernesmea oryzae]SEK19499.1 DNA-nicking endonuclease, Smr domain [Xaviernesmea oryzae]
MAKDKTLSAEDRILWGKVARTTRALPGRMERLALEDEAAEPQAVSREDAKVGKAAQAAPPAGDKVALRTAQKIPQPLEKPVHRKLSRGRLPIEARLDLHGMFQGEAYDLLLGFLTRAHQRGLRHVLVITGKGTSMGSEGALKRMVPMWFALSDFRPLISSYDNAARGHGGEGALYVRLARNPGLSHHDDDPFR